MMGPPDLSGVVDSFSMPIVVRDYAADSVTAEGLIAAGAAVDVASVGHYFPAKGDDIARLELQSGGGAYEVHVPQRHTLTAVVQGSQQRASVVIFEGRTFEVAALGRWFSGPNGAAGYQQAWVQEVTR
jgi:hypothetical protein